MLHILLKLKSVSQWKFAIANQTLPHLELPSLKTRKPVEELDPDRSFSGIVSV
tara:strand:- start:1012 stop:1170 length:159 start_codon:yes stop_codon:yes gene_type:complete